MKRWTAEEISTLKTAYATTENKALIRLFSGRTLTSLRKKAYSLGLKREGCVEYINRSNGREWTHNRQKNRKGYVLIYKPEHPRADTYGRVFEHIVVWEECYKKSVPKGYVIHHINGVKDDNRIDNLLLLSNGDHTALHNANRVVSKETKQKMSDKAKCRRQKII